METSLVAFLRTWKAGDPESSDLVNSTLSISRLGRCLSPVFRTRFVFAIWRLLLSCAIRLVGTSLKYGDDSRYACGPTKEGSFTGDTLRVRSTVLFVGCSRSSRDWECL